MLCCVFIIDCAEVEDEKSRWWRLPHVATNVPSDTTVVNDVIMVWVSLYI